MALMKPLVDDAGGAKGVSSSNRTVQVRVLPHQCGTMDSHRDRETCKGYSNLFSYISAE